MEHCCTVPKEWGQESSNVYQGGDKKKIVPICLCNSVTNLYCRPAHKILLCISTEAEVVILKARKSAAKERSCTSAAKRSHFPHNTICSARRGGNVYLVRSFTIQFSRQTLNEGNACIRKENKRKQKEKQ